MLLTKKTIMVICLLVLTAFWSSDAFAHKVMVFGWVEGDMVKTISKFSGGKRVQKAPVTVYNKKGELLVEGKTDVNGEYAFKIPAEKEIEIILEASMGHKTSCIVELSSDDEPVDEQVASRETSEKDSGNRSIAVKEIEAVVEKALDKKMAVVLNMIAEKEDKQSVSEIISGIGYILGLIGIGLWVRNR